MLFMARISLPITVPLSRQLVRLNDAPRPRGPQKVVAQCPGERQAEDTPELDSSSHM